MKKLMVAVAIVCAAAMSQASTYYWGAQTGKIYDGLGADGKGASAIGKTAYLVDAGVYTMEAIVADWAANGAINTSKIIAGSDGTVNSDYQVGYTSDFAYGNSADFSAYFVVVNGANLYVSPDTVAAYSALPAPVAIDFETSNTSPSKKMFQAADGYSQAGWYQTVPEPTSGLLLLLGVAGLALRRRRA